MHDCAAGLFCAGQDDTSPGCLALTVTSGRDANINLKMDLTIGHGGKGGGDGASPWVSPSSERPTFKVLHAQSRTRSQFATLHRSDPLSPTLHLYMFI